MRRVIKATIDAAPATGVDVLANIIRHALEERAMDVIKIGVGSWEYRYRDNPKSWRKD